MSRHLSTITKKEAKVLADLAFVYAQDRKSYKFKHTKVYVINNHQGEFDRIVIVDEDVKLGEKNKNLYSDLLMKYKIHNEFDDKPTDHDYILKCLWSKDHRLIWSSADHPDPPRPLYNWIEIDSHYVIHTHKIFSSDMTKYLIEDSQYNIFIEMEKMKLL